MSTSKSSFYNRPSVLALLIDDIAKMSESEQKLLWMELNKEKLSVLSRQLDTSVSPHHLSSDDIDELISEAKENGKK